MATEGTRPGPGRMTAGTRAGAARPLHSRRCHAPGTPARHGAFITIDGPDGGGKTTQAERLRDHLAARGCAVHLTREPGGTWLGERVRDVLLARTGVAPPPTDPLTDALLFNAARRQLVGEVIRPGARRPARPWSAPGSPTRRWPTRATAPACRSTTCARSTAIATDGLAPGPDDPARPAGRGRARAQGARRRDPLRGRVRPGLPSPRARRVPGPRGGRAGALRGRRCDARRRRRGGGDRRRPSTDRLRVGVNRNRPACAVHG